MIAVADVTRTEVVTAWSWFGCAVGVVILLCTAASVVGTLVVPHNIESRISRSCERTVDVVFRLATRRVRGFVHRDRILVWQGPSALLLRLAVWLGLLVVGYALALLPTVSGSLGRALSDAGSSLFTLGYAAPTNSTSSALDYLAAFTGLVVIGLQVGYLPTFYAAFNRRETLVTMLTTRAGVPAWGPEILARLKWGIYDGEPGPVLRELFQAWEGWSADVAESHTTYQALAWLRSPRPLSHWLTSMLAVLDAAALHLALTPSSEPKHEARLCLRVGFVALNQIARAMRLPAEDDPDPDAPISVSYEEFADAVGMLRTLNYPIERPTELAWPDFRGWRANYDTAALALARALDAPPALWSGDRRWPARPMPPLRPPTRLPRPRERT
ncbi:hypothetical protein [Amycolatopsis taiwanensis]|uniref:Uncharacterized protein n=1 Tax=Amycolatopsis taiwanensis TaxID=342230 RepID=A0A9W6VGI4_9PSEU|nr:hypothetical protein [Amycolatopsis taiwanensis]GLY67805.1 hypothetical protein Atai01_44240 [Amycolatopsis taiwanensis]